MENCIRDDYTPLRMFCYENVVKGLFSLRKGSDIKKSNYFLEDLVCSKIEDRMFRNENRDQTFTVEGLRQEENLVELLKLSHN
jgi:hypothetical protein